MRCRLLQGFLRLSWPLRLLILMLTTLALSSWLHSLGFRVVWTSTSQPPGIYRAVERFPERHQLGLVVLPTSVAAVGRERGYLVFAEVGKCIAALPGDWVEVTANAIRVNGRALPDTAQLPFDSAGRPMSRLRVSRHQVPVGQVWLYSNFTPLSWDSRYFGPVPVDAVRGTLLPLLTFPAFPTTADGDTTCNWNATDI